MTIGGYDIIVIPRNPAKTKRIRLSSFTVGLSVFAGILAIPFLVASLFSTVHYQKKLHALTRRVAENHQILKQQETITARMANLERILAHTEESLEAIEKVADMELGQIQKGLGPIHVDELISETELETLPTADVDIENWLERGGQVTLKAIRSKMSNMGERLDGLNTRIDEIYALNQDKINFIDALPSLMPVEGWVTSDFGGRRNPHGRGSQMHYGLDIASPSGTPIHAPADGKVLVADTEGGYGRMIIIEHGYGVTTLYGHASQLFVKEGQAIKRGDVIAAVGSSGASTGPHLHYEVHVDGIPTDPVNYITE